LFPNKKETAASIRPSAITKKQGKLTPIDKGKGNRNDADTVPLGMTGVVLSKTPFSFFLSSSASLYQTTFAIPKRAASSSVPSDQEGSAGKVELVLHAIMVVVCVCLCLKLCGGVYSRMRARSQAGVWHACRCCSYLVS
jgi:hypothetical protein